MVSYEEVLNRQVLPIGRWQWRSFSLFILSSPFILIFFPIFPGFRPVHFCRPEGFDSRNWSVNQWINLTVPLSNEIGSNGQTHDSCKTYKLLDSITRNNSFTMTKEMMKDAIDGANYTAEPCTNGMIYLKNSVAYRSTLIEAFDLVCDRAHFYLWSTIIFMIGFMIGAGIFGLIGDKYGRRRVSILSLLLCMASSVLTSLAPSISVFMIGRLLCGVFTQGHHVVTYSLIMEISGPSGRDIFNTLSATYIGVFMPLIYVMQAYLIQDWRWLHLFMTSNLLLVFLYFPFMPESPRWLLTQGRRSEAVEVLKQGASVNRPGVEIEIDLNCLAEGTTESLRPETQEASIVELFRTSLLRRITCFMVFIWFSHSLNYYGASFYSVKLPGVSPYLSFSTPSLLKAVFLSGQYLMARRLLRRPVLVAYQLTGGVCCFVVAFVYLVPGIHPGLKNILGIVFMSVFLGCVLSGFAMIYVYTSELFPTSLRSRGLGICSVFSRVGAALAPMVVDLDRSLGHRWLPMALCGAVQLISCFGGLFVPETKNRPLSDTPQELKMNLYSSKRRGHNHDKESEHTLFDL